MNDKFDDYEANRLDEVFIASISSKTDQLNEFEWKLEPDTDIKFKINDELDVVLKKEVNDMVCEFKTCFRIVFERF